MIRRVIRLPIFFVLLAPFALLAPVYATGKALFWGTPILQFVPWWVWSWRTLRSGELPLWNPLLGMGAPLIANYQSALFYPPNWSYFLLAEIGGEPLLAWGQAVLVAAHLAWAGLGMALLARRLGLQRLAQLISGLAFGMSGYLVARSGFLSINAAAAWLPWVILGVTNLFKNGDYGLAWRDWIGTRKKELILLSLAVGLQLLAGHAQTGWYTLLLAGLWGAYLAFTRFRATVLKGKFRTLAHRQSERESDFQSLFRRIARVWTGMGVAVILATALASVQLFPTGEYLLQSQRASEVDYELGMTYSFWPWRLVTLIAPDMFGNPVHGDYWGYANFWEDAIYVGLIPFLLAISALVRGMRKKQVSEFQSGLIRFLFFVISISLLLALGSNTPIYPWLYRHVPTFDMFQAPTRFTIWAVFSLALLAGIGANYWQRPSGRGLYWTRLGTAGAVAVALGSGLAWYLMGDISPSFIRSTAMAGIWGVTAGALTLLAPHAGPTSEEWGGLGLKYDQDQIDRWSTGVGVIISLDLIIAGWGLNPGIEAKIYAGQSTSGGQLSSKLEDGRLLVPQKVEHEIKFERFFRFDTFSTEESWADLRSTLLPNTNLLDGLPTVNNFDPILNGRYVRWMEVINQSDGKTQERLLNLMGVQVVERVESSPSLEVAFEPRDAFSRFRWVPCAHPVDSEDIALKGVIGGEINLQEVVILESKSESLDPDCQIVGVSNIEKVTESPNNIVIRTSTSSAGYLVVADQWYPGWRAQLDGKEVEIFRADFLFRAIQLPAGNHEVILRYRPAWFYAGGIISLLTCLGMALSLIFIRREKIA